MNEIFAKTSNDPQRPPTTLLFHLCHMETEQNTFGDCQHPERLSTTGCKFGAESGNLNEDFKRPSTTMKDRQQLAVIPNDTGTQMTAKDRQ